MGKDFYLVVIGQIVSLFGNAILRFALPLYILEVSGSPALFGTVLALSSLPLIIMSPIGGVVADRVNKKRIMVALDFTASAMVIIYAWASGFTPLVPATVAMLMTLFAIQGMMHPAVESSVPLLVPANQLVRANAVVFLISALSGMVGPAIGGILFAGFGIRPILIVAAISLALAALMELFIRIPHPEQEPVDNVFTMVIKDLGKGLRFVFKEKPILAKITVIIFFLQFVLSPLIIIGLPVLIIQNLGFDGQMLGIAQGVMATGGVAGGIMASVLGERLRIQNNHILVLICALSCVPMGIVFLLDAGAMAAYIVITASIPAALCASVLFSVRTFAYVQAESPPDMVGKVMAFFLMLALLAQPLGHFMYGILFERFAEMPWFIIFGAVILSSIMALYSRRHFTAISETNEPQNLQSQDQDILPLDSHLHPSSPSPPGI